MIILDFFISAFKDWLSLFMAPVHNWDMLWILIPVYLGWAFTEFYQEKKGTSYGNAVSNGIIVLWVGVDWTRNTFNLAMSAGFSNLLLTKFFISALMFAYGLLIIVHAMGARASSFYIGKIRLVSYIIIMFTPLFYDVVHLTFSVLFAIIVFFPIYYLVIELIDMVIPDPKALTEDIGKGKSEFENIDRPIAPYQQQYGSYPQYGQYNQQQYNQHYQNRQQGSYNQNYPYSQQFQQRK